MQEVALKKEKCVHHRNEHRCYLSVIRLLILSYFIKVLSQEKVKTIPLTIKWNLKLWTSNKSWQCNRQCRQIGPCLPPSPFSDF